MSNEFEGMIDGIQGSRAEEARKSKETAQSILDQAMAEFKMKGRCLIEVVKPTLTEAKDTFGKQGLELIIQDNLDTGPTNAARDPAIAFSFKKTVGAFPGLNVVPSLKYSIIVGHTQGGLTARRIQENMRVPATDWGAFIGTNTADNLTREHVVAFIKAALKDATC